MGKAIPNDQLILGLPLNFAFCSLEPFLPHLSRHVDY